MLHHVPVWPLTSDRVLVLCLQWHRDGRAGEMCVWTHAQCVGVLRYWNPYDVTLTQCFSDVMLRVLLQVSLRCTCAISSFRPSWTSTTLVWTASTGWGSFWAAEAPSACASSQTSRYVRYNVHTYTNVRHENSLWFSKIIQVHESYWLASFIANKPE